MRELNENELLKIDGGGANPVLVTSIIGVVVTFVVGLLHGYSNPKKCNN